MPAWFTWEGVNDLLPQSRMLHSHVCNKPSEIGRDGIAWVSVCTCRYRVPGLLMQWSLWFFSERRKKIYLDQILSCACFSTSAFPPCCDCLIFLPPPPPPPPHPPASPPAPALAACLTLSGKLLFLLEVRIFAYTTSYWSPCGCRPIQVFAGKDHLSDRDLGP